MIYLRQELSGEISKLAYKMIKKKILQRARGKVLALYQKAWYNAMATLSGMGLVCQLKKGDCNESQIFS